MMRRRLLAAAGGAAAGRGGAVVKRRLVLLCAGSAAFARGGAQTTERVWRVGILRPTAPPLSVSEPMAVAIPGALRELAYVEGRNLAIETRWAGGNFDRLPALARELVQAKVDVIVAVGSPAVRAAKDATALIPIVMYGNFDPVALGLVTSLAQPGGNVTGVLIAPDGTLAGKKLELLKSAVPKASRMAFLAPSDDSGFRLQVQETRVAAMALGIDLQVTEVRGGDYERAFAAITAQRAGALFVGAHTSFTRDRAQIITLAAKHRLPAMYEWREQVVDGGLMSYGSSLQGSYQRVASYVDRILKGASPAGMAVERPTKFELVINRETARALGLTIPQSLLLRADEVIQ
jgi:putative ABC transport system substrate-binding protein